MDTGATGGLLQAVLGLAVVLALIWGAAWIMRRLQPNIGGAQGALKLVASQAVGQRERIVVVEIADQWLVVGVAPGNVNAIASLSKGTLPPPVPVTNTFASLLARARGDSRA
ncbi:MAG TPA: flagellar biosynthetic protein FliO [Burkholderiales bacterium]|nr:flagellar biosynthetic protein FliO [Burkholderiales bacterium]